MLTVLKNSHYYTYAILNGNDVYLRNTKHTGRAYKAAREIHVTKASETCFDIIAISSAVSAPRHFECGLRLKILNFINKVVQINIKSIKRHKSTYQNQKGAAQLGI